MKVMICASMSFAAEMKRSKADLEKLGHEVLVTKDLQYIIDNPDLPDNLDADYKHCVENNIFHDFFALIAASDATLVLNYPRNGVEGYMGTSTLMEVAVGYYLHKKIYLLHPVPDYHHARWAHEVAIMQPTVIDNDLRKIG